MSSLLCWTIIIVKNKNLKYAAKRDKLFLDLFWKGKTMEEIFAQIDTVSGSPTAVVFKAGFRELKKVPLEEIRKNPALEMENIQRALFRTSTTEIGNLEKHLSWLATTASAAPFIGLFGTVWGIMTSFQGIAQTGNASLAIVAPGISEALIATAVGLAAAIPAVIAYNHFATKIKKLANDMDCFSQDFLNIIQRSFLSGN
jgi:biopolymer transport protein TolQ